MTASSLSTPGALTGYDAGGGHYDEAVDADGVPRPAAAPSLAAIAREGDLEGLCARLAGVIERAGVSFHSVDGDARFNVDPVPRVFEAADWAALEAGLIQRVRALDLFVSDVYGEQAIVAAGIVPEDAIASCDYFERTLVGTHPPAACGAASRVSTSCEAPTAGSWSSRTTCAPPPVSATPSPPVRRSRRCWATSSPDRARSTA